MAAKKTIPVKDGNKNDDSAFMNEVNPDYNWKWHNFIKYILNGELRYVAYGKAFNVEYATPSQKNVCQVAASKLLRRETFQLFWSEYLQGEGFNDGDVDNRLMQHIQDRDPRVSLTAISEYNKLRGRIVSKLDHTTGGKEFKQPTVINMGGQGFDEDKQ